MQKSKKKIKNAKSENSVDRKKKLDPLFEIEGNQKLNKLRKLQFKKEKKDRVRKGMKITNNQLFTYMYIYYP